MAKESIVGDDTLWRVYVWTSGVRGDLMVMKQGALSL